MIKMTDEFHEEEINPRNINCMHLLDPVTSYNIGTKTEPRWVSWPYHQGCFGFGRLKKLDYCDERESPPVLEISFIGEDAPRLYKFKSSNQAQAKLAEIRKLA